MSRRTVFPTHTDNNKRIAKNSLYLYLRTFLSIVITLYTSRVCLNQLGVEDYGIYNLIGGIITIFSTLNTLMTSTTQRFFSIAIGDGNSAQLYKILNISISLQAFIALLFFCICEISGIMLLSNYLEIPPEKKDIAFIIFHLSIITTAFGMLKTPYNALIIAKERMSFFAYISIVEVILKLIITLLLVYFTNKLIIYSCMILFVTGIVTLIYYLYCFKYIGLPSYKFHKIRENNEYKELLSFSGWSFLGNSSIVCRDQGLSIILNIFFGVLLNSAMGIMTQVANVYSSLFFNLQSAFKPQIIQNSKNNRSRYLELINICTLYSFLLMGAVCIPMLMFCRQILTFWLDIVPDYTIGIVQIVMIKILIASFSQSIYTSLEANAKIRNIQIFSVLLSILSLIIAYWLLYQGFTPYIVIFIQVVADFILCIYNLYYSSKKKAIELFKLLEYNYKAVLFVLLLCCIALYISSHDYSFTQHATHFVLFCITYLLCSFYCMEKKHKMIALLKLREIFNVK